MPPCSISKQYRDDLEEDWRGVWFACENPERPPDLNVFCYTECRPCMTYFVAMCHNEPEVWIDVTGLDGVRARAMASVWLELMEANNARL
jgi:hypothetical protein